MKGPVNLTDPKVGIAVLFLVSVLALVLMLTVRSKNEPPATYRAKNQYHTDGFDFGGFKKDMLILGLIVLPFLIVFLLRFL
jgi:uncharacterized membrane protein